MLHIDINRQAFHKLCKEVLLDELLEIEENFYDWRY